MTQNEISVTILYREKKQQIAQQRTHANKLDLEHHQQNDDDEKLRVVLH